MKVNDLVRIPIRGMVPAMDAQLFYTDAEDFVFWRVSGIVKEQGSALPTLVIKPFDWPSRCVH